LEVRLPFLAEGVEECVVTFWHVAEGDTVEEDDDLAEMQTSKAIFNVPSPAGGTIKEILVNEGDVVKVGDILCIID